MQCFAYEGIDAIKAALRTGLSFSTEELAISINLIAPPKYVMTVTSLDREQGIALLEKATRAIQESITAAGGELSVAMAPRAVTEADDRDLAEMMKELAMDGEPAEGEEGEEEGMGSGEVA